MAKQYQHLINNDVLCFPKVWRTSLQQTALNTRICLFWSTHLTR